ncbi:MAG: DUF4199 domain-containing protein [Bacteroidetes bacterium]|nr:DUF4199 domain-containing protein [Bacteroidota bacterium]
MKKIALVYGLIAGAIFFANIVVLISLMHNNPKYEGSLLVGYTIIVLTFSLIFFGVKNYRDKLSNGIISFGKAFKLGLFIMLIASTIYVLTWVIGSSIFVPDFMERYSESVIAEATKTGQDVAAVTKEMEEFKAMYKNPLFMMMMTYLEVLPAGLLISLVSALMLKRKTKQAA